MQQHLYWMEKALKIAQKAEGHTAPNPKVGCVLVKNDRMISEGYHQSYGTEHAELHALNASSENPAGATAYVTLEPCCHQGKQPPCTDALIHAQIAHVVVAIKDPDLQVSGQGLQKLHDAGIKVTLGIAADQAFQINQGFMKHRITKQPFIRAKWAMSLDGKIATEDFKSRWISNAESRIQSHMLRQSSQAIMIGNHTLNQDNPSLTTSLDIPHLSHPIPIIIAQNTPLNLQSQLFQNPRTVVITPSHYSSPLPSNIEHIPVETAHDQYINILDILKILGNKDITSVLIEGGGNLLSHFMKQRLIDHYHCFIAPKLIGGAKAPTPFDGQGFRQMNEVSELTLKSTDILGDNIYAQYENPLYTAWEKEQIKCLQVL